MPTLPLVAVAYVAGSALAVGLGGAWWLTVLAALPFAAALRLHPATRLSYLALAAALAFAGASHARLDAALARPSPLATIEGRHELLGIARSEPVLDGSSARLDLDVHEVDGAPASGTVRLTLRASPGGPTLPRAGDVVRASGTVRPPSYEGTPRARIAFPRWSVVGREEPSAITRALRGARSWSLANIEQALPEPQAALAAGVLFGEERAVPEGLTHALRVTGTAHLLVVSGQNISILLGAVVALLSAIVPRRRAGLAALALLPAYVVMTGAEPPVLRAAIMAAGIGVAAATGRRTPAWIFLAYAAAAMLALDPRLARDVSFQMSASATAGVLLLAPPLAEVVVAPLARLPHARRLVAPVAEAAVVAIAAAAAVIPVQAATFHTASLVQVPANAAVAVFYQGTVFVAVAAALLGWLEPAAALIHAAGALVPAAFIALTHTFAQVPGASLPLVLPVTAWLGWYLAVAAALWLLAHREQGRLALSASAHAPVRRVVLATSAFGLWFVVLAPAPSLASVTVLDVGQGLAVLVRDGGASVLVDTGPPDGAVLAALGRAGQRGPLGAAVLSHDDADHLGGTAEVLRRIGARRVLAAPSVPASRADGLQHIDLGDRVLLSPRVAIEVLAPATRTMPAGLDSDNDRGLALLVTVGRRRFLLPADLEAPAERWLLASGQPLRADVLVVPHHGSRSSSTAEFVAAVAPAVAVVSVGERNSYGHPAPEVLARYDSARVLRTDQVGEVTLRTDGARLWMSGAHPPTAGAQPTPRATVRPPSGTVTSGKTASGKTAE